MLWTCRQGDKQGKYCDYVTRPDAPSGKCSIGRARCQLARPWPAGARVLATRDPRGFSWSCAASCCI